jgi:hypothetical protein
LSQLAQSGVVFVGDFERFTANDPFELLTGLLKVLLKVVELVVASSLWTSQGIVA